eukprot:CAMPEP_0170064944 /NCGR_PEP_ID=MMETSP0019_2-20121128/5225_1 /TAXON_ID=98059 /ORGANISM="Dinobryon sp., Strain UTEXLB2267" /LENGTH=104 /DNA_ID=CAMNT_0010271707 /DNA_START=503 /DNA_END=817 /DNA_ORIENTATION=-
MPLSRERCSYDKCHRHHCCTYNSSGATQRDASQATATARPAAQQVTSSACRDHGTEDDMSATTADAKEAWGPSLRTNELAEHNACDDSLRLLGHEVEHTVLLKG